MSDGRDDTPAPRREVLYEGRIVDLVRLDGRWEVAEHAPGVAVLVLEGSKVLGVRQDRPATGRRTWELPAGLVDPGESPEQAAARELAEEVGLGGKLELLTRMYTSPGFTDEIIYLFRATHLEPAHGEADEDEDLEAVWLDAEAAWQSIAQGRLISSAPTVAGLAYARAVLAEK